MKKFLEDNGFVKIPKRGKHVKAEYCYPNKEIFVTLFQNGDWSVSKAGTDNLNELEMWRSKLADKLNSK